MALARAGEPDERTVFYFSVATVLAGLLCMTRAYSRGSTLVVANLP
jgi:hypothetical protein